MPENPDYPEIVYHYTTMDTMMKIAETATIWATSAEYLNDASEGDYFLKSVNERIPKYRANLRLDDQAIFNECLSAIVRDIGSCPFVASFSQDGDSLPQWRSYCPNGNGVAIGFRVDCLKSSFVTTAKAKSVLPLESNVKFLKVDYLDKLSLESVDGEIAKLVSQAKLPAAAYGFLNPGMRLLIQMRMTAYSKKHFSFSNEREFRLLVYAETDWLEFRAVRSTLVPYVSLGIRRKPSRYPDAKVKAMDSGRSDFIGRVVIGPSPNSNLSKSAVEFFFQKLKLNVEVVSSNIPYREW